jgi:hypothetical protein
MYTSVMLVALSGCCAHSLPEVQSPRWLDDYWTACQQSAEQKKPLAVFVGSGAEGWEKLSRDGKLGKEAREILSSAYVCLYIDSSTREGGQLARAFDLPDGWGVVLSDRGGTKQAFHHRGDLKGEDLEYYLKKYADPNVVVRTTETNPPERGTASGYSSYYQPTYYQPTFGGFGGGRGC